MGECLIIRRGGEPYELPVLNGAYPANVTVMEAANASASFNVQIATPGKPAEYAYQWYLNGAKISGATSSGYTKTGLTAAKTYTLYCVVTNKAGTVTSRTATLTVKSALPAYTYTGNHQLINDGNYKWRIKLLTSGTLKFTSLGNAKLKGVDVFLVGGGAGGSTGGGGGGYTKTERGNVAKEGVAYQCVVGAGGARYSNGGASYITNLTSAGVEGGKTNDIAGGNGGSGGGGGSSDYTGEVNGAIGGSNGGNGGAGENAGGIGQSTTTREFGESGGTLYSGGGGGGGRSRSGGSGGSGGGGNGGYSGSNVSATPGKVNTGGGGGGKYYREGASGGSGIIIIRNHRG